MQLKDYLATLERTMLDLEANAAVSDMEVNRPISRACW